MGAAVDQWGPLAASAQVVRVGSSRLMWGSKAVGSGEWYLTVQSADPLRTVESHSPPPTPLGCQVPLPTPHAVASLPLFQRRGDDARLLGSVRGGVPLGGARALGPADGAERGVRPHGLPQFRLSELLRAQGGPVLLHPDAPPRPGIAPDQPCEAGSGEQGT